MQNGIGISRCVCQNLKQNKQPSSVRYYRTADSGTSLSDLVANRLETLGFVPGTQVQVITKGIFGGDPILIQVGFTRFALRKVEAERIEIEQGVSA